MKEADGNRLVLQREVKVDGVLAIGVGSADHRSSSNNSGRWRPAMKIALLLAVLATLALTGVASAAAPPFGHLTGGASLATSIGITSIDVNSTVFDGELVFFARNNDKSNDCDGDTGSVDILYETLASATYNIACAHYTGSAFSFDYFDSALNTFIVVVVYRNDPSFEVYVGSTTNATLAMQWVNRGWAGSGARKLGLAFPEVESAGDYTITA